MHREREREASLVGEEMPTAHQYKYSYYYRLPRKLDDQTMYTVQYTTSFAKVSHSLSYTKESYFITQRKMSKLNNHIV